MDEGGHFTQQVRARCAARWEKKLFCIKGIYGGDKPYTAPPQKQRITIEGSYYGEAWQYQIGVDSGKQLIFDNIKVQVPGTNYCHFPLRDDYGAAYFKGLLSETLTYDETKKNPWVWKKIPGHERNERLDCRNYALAAFAALTVNLDEREKRIREMGQKLNEPKKPAIEPKVKTAERVKPKPARRKGIAQH